MSRDRNIVKIDRKEDELSQITMLNAKDVQKILQVSQAKAYEIIRSLNMELKEKGFYVFKERSIRTTLKRDFMERNSL